MDRPYLGTAATGRDYAKVVTAMYDELETNIPHQWMTFSDAPISSEQQLFPSRQAVSAYIENYAEPVKHMIKFHTEMVDVCLDSSDSKTWLVRTRDLVTANETTGAYDAVVICTGHYNMPYVPSCKGLVQWQEQYPGAVTHSKYFRNMDPFRNQKVLVVGNAASAVDIAAHIKRVAKTPVLMTHRSESWLSTGKSVPGIQNVREIRELISSDGRRAVRFVDGHVEENIDKVIFCTGYLYSYPFLKSLGAELIDDGARVHNLFEQMFYVDHPTLAFSVLPLRVIPFPMSEVQAAVIARVWSGRLRLPLKEQMRASESEMANTNGSGKLYHTLTHPKDFDYHNRMYDWAAQTGESVGKMGVRWNARDYWVRQQFPFIKQAFAARGEERHQVRTIEELGFDYDASRREHQDT